ncbi:MAG: prepilin-type N-terminal cleavage/methylation domain-containing protein [Actinomycetota bacterium]|nr:prepilin-type N-terminal cleavage/methylation domain-containing protein [Actinomycetota bacterium]
MLSTMQRYKARLEKDRGDEGFTLIELLIVIIILAILATIVIFAVGTTTKNAALASCQSTVKTVQTALEAYKAQTPTGSYPTALTKLATTVTVGTTTKGPWLKTAPHTGATTVTKYGWAFVAYNSATGKFTVKTKGTTGAARSTSTPSVCKGA